MLCDGLRIEVGSTRTDFHPLLSLSLFLFFSFFFSFFLQFHEQVENNYYYYFHGQHACLHACVLVIRILFCFEVEEDLTQWPPAQKATVEVDVVVVIVVMVAAAATAAAVALIKMNLKRRA